MVIMAKFNPLDFKYELVQDDEDSLLYQKKIISEESVFTDLIELGYFKKANVWGLFITGSNLKSYLPSYKEIPNISLYIGKIKNNMNFRFLLNNICKDPKVIIQLGS